VGPAAAPLSFPHVTLFQGAVCDSENEHLACLLRARSTVLVAFGRRAHLDGIPEFSDRILFPSPLLENCMGCISFQKGYKLFCHFSILSTFCDSYRSPSMNSLLHGQLHQISYIL